MGYRLLLCLLQVALVPVDQLRHQVVKFLGKFDGAGDSRADRRRGATEDESSDGAVPLDLRHRNVVLRVGDNLIIFGKKTILTLRLLPTPSNISTMGTLYCRGRPLHHLQHIAREYVYKLYMNSA